MRKLNAYILASLIVSSGIGYLLFVRWRKRRIEEHLRRKGFKAVQGAGLSVAEVQVVYPLSRATAKESCFSNGDHAVYWVDWPLASTGGSVRYTVYQAGGAGRAHLEARHRSINKGSPSKGVVHPNASWLWVSEESGLLGSALVGDAEVMRLLAKWEGSLYISDDNFYLVSGRNLQRPSDVDGFIADATHVKKVVDFLRQRDIPRPRKTL